MTRTRDFGSKCIASARLILAALLTFVLASSAAAGTFKRITIDGSFADWAGVPLAYSDASETTAGADFRDVYVANDEQYLYIRFTLFTNNSPFTSRNNIFVDADNNPGTGFHPLGLAALGSEMLIQSGSGYQEKNGGFNEGAINGLGWAAAPTENATDFEIRIARAATYATDGLIVFDAGTIAILLEAENTSFAAVDLAPDSGALAYTFTNPPPVLTGNLQLLPLISSAWRYDQSGNNLDVAWRDPVFDDAGGGWDHGTAPFGFTTNASVYPVPIQTPLVAGTATYYFRARFDWTNDPAGVVLVSSNYLSDGAVIYLNGTEMKRLRLPAGPVMFDTPATGGPAVKGQAELVGFPAGALVIGENVLAVETHHTAGEFDDMVFGLSLVASTQFPVVFTDAAQPTNRTVVAGQATTFAVEVIGSPPLAYQWYKGGQPITDATNATFSLGPVLAIDAGLYHVVVSNSLPSAATSRRAALTVTGEPVRITDAAQPADQSVTEGNSVTFNVVAVGSAPLTYQWFKGTTPITDATNASYTIASVRMSDAGSYRAVVSNPLPSSVTSRTAALAVAADTARPTILKVVASFNRVIITFSESVDEITAGQPGNYSIGGGVNVPGAVRSSENPAEVILTTSAQSFGAFRCITISNVRDLFNNTILPGTTTSLLPTILIDGTFDDWTGVPLVYTDGMDQLTASDYKDIYITNDADYIFIRVTLHSPSDLGIFYNNIFIDADGGSSGYSFQGVGSEMLIQGGGGYQEKNGGFNEGGINGLDWAIFPEGFGTDFELRFSRRATYETDGLPVFTNSSINLVFDAETTSFQTVDTAPDAGGLTYVLFEPPTVPGPLRIERVADQISISWPGAGALQFRESLTSGAWQTVWEGPSPFDAGTPVGQGFYRLALPCP